MLDEHQFEQINAVYRECIRAVQQRRENDNIPLDRVDLATAFAPVLAAWIDLTGFQETNPNAVLHHRMALYGPPCHTCGKPLRSPAASFCAACGATQ